MRWWQLYYAIKDGWELQKYPEFKGLSYEVFLVSSWFLEKDFYRYPLVDRIARWGQAVAKFLINSDASYLNLTKRELDLFYEKLKPLLRGGTGRGFSPNNLDLIHAFLIKTYGDVEKVYNLTLWEVAENLYSTYLLLELQKRSKEK